MFAQELKIRDNDTQISDKFFINIFLNFLPTLVDFRISRYLNRFQIQIIICKNNK